MIARLFLLFFGKLLILSLCDTTCQFERCKRQSNLDLSEYLSKFLVDCNSNQGVVYSRLRPRTRSRLAIYHDSACLSVSNRLDFVDVD